MNRDDLLKLLDLAGKEAGPTESATDLAITSPTDETEKPPREASPTALELDAWGLRRGQEVLADSERLQALQLDALAIADFFGSAFEPDPQLQENCVDARRHDFLKQLLETPDYQALHATTMLNEAASAIAATSFAEQFAGLKGEEGSKEDEAEKEGGKKDDVSKDEATKDKAEAMKEKAEKEGEKEMETLRAVGRALTRASEEVTEARDAAAALGLGPGSPGSNNPHVVAALYRRVRNNPNLKRICELAGRFRRLAQSKQRRKTIHGQDDMVGVVLDGDLGRALPHELVKLAIPELEDDTLHRLVERQLMSRDHRTTEPVAKGPILVSVDESGSMAGEKGHTAKALALALAWIARQQRRWCGLVAYSGSSGERLLPLPPGRWDEGKLLDWLIEFIGCGSDLDVPVRELPDYYQRLGAPVGDTDVILITDAICSIPDPVQATFRAWKEKVKARVIALIIQSEPGHLALISDEVHQVNALSCNEEGVERVLSI